MTPLESPIPWCEIPEGFKQLTSKFHVQVPYVAPRIIVPGAIGLDTLNPSGQRRSRTFGMEDMEINTTVLSKALPGSLAVDGPTDPTVTGGTIRAAKGTVKVDKCKLTIQIWRKGQVR